jgi:hypothetical protein
VHDFARWLQEKYGTVAALSGAWRRPVRSFDDLPSPGDGRAAGQDDLPPQLDRLAWRDTQTDTGDAGDVLDYLGDVAPALSRPVDRRQVYAAMRTLSRTLNADGSHPSLAEVLGRLPDGVAPPERAFAAAAALMHGATPEGATSESLRGDAATLAGALASENWELDRKALLLYPRVYAHVRHLARGGQLAHAEMSLGFERPLQTEGPALLKKFLDLATRVGLPFAIGDTRLPVEVLRQFPLVICPTLEVLSAGAMRTFDAYLAGGGFLAIGPRVPLVDETMRSSDTLARYFGEGLTDFAAEVIHCDSGSLLTLPGYVSAATIEFLAFESGMARGLVADAPGLATTVRRAGSHRLVCVANANPEATHTTFSGEAFTTFRDILTANPIAMTPDKALTVPPRTITAWRVT